MATMLDYWANLISEEAKNIDFRLNDFLSKHKLDLEMLLYKPNENVYDALIKCRNLNNPILQVADYDIHYKWAMLKYALQHPHVDHQMKKNIDQLLYKDYLVGDLEYKYNIAGIHDIIIEYCKNNGTSISPLIMHQVLGSILNIMANKPNNLKILIQYAFKNNILGSDIFALLLMEEHVDLLVYAIK